MSHEIDKLIINILNNIFATNGLLFLQILNFGHI